MARRGRARLGKVRSGKARHGEVRQGWAGPGEVRRGKARQGMGYQGTKQGGRAQEPGTIVRVSVAAGQELRRRSREQGRSVVSLVDKLLGIGLHPVDRTPESVNEDPGLRYDRFEDVP